MQITREISRDTYYVGGSDRRIALFENIYPLSNGVSYNSYVILDEKTALLDTVDNSIRDLFFENLEKTLNGRKLDYLKSLEDEKVINSEYKQFATQNIEHDFLNLPPNPRSHAKVIEQKASNEFILEFEEKLKFKAYKCMSLSHDVKVGDTVLYEIFGNECFILHVLKNS
jgi:hypothetical protein